MFCVGRRLISFFGRLADKLNTVNFFAYEKSQLYFFSKGLVSLFVLKGLIIKSSDLTLCSYILCLPVTGQLHSFRT